MKDITVTKRQVMKALDTEPLRKNRWVANSSLPEIGNCHVCAVGAVLRHAGLANNVISEYVVGPSELISQYGAVTTGGLTAARVAAQNGEWLRALSIVFETYGKARARRYVQQEFPASIVLKGAEVEAAARLAFRAMISEIMYSCANPPVDVSNRYEWADFTPAERRRLNTWWAKELKKA